MAKESLYKKLLAVLSEVDRIPKNGHNAHFNYDYVLDADLVDHIRPLMVKHNLLMLPNVEETTQNGNIATAKMRYRFIDPETGDSEDVFFTGQGQDTGDKGYYKAYTGAEKYCLMKTFLVATGDDPERDNDDAPRRKENAKPPPAPKPVEQPKPAAPIGTAPKSANAPKTDDAPTSKDWTAFWTAARALGLDTKAVHAEAAPYFDVPQLKSLNDVPGLTAGGLRAFAKQLKEIVGQATA